mmetsp:Transcript_10074/g.15118  ORF Transcript_10074/g.15118 Transcript_10074/m.15118 type:complete len:91 (-) Transcript_10074:211-483(-)
MMHPASCFAKFMIAVERKTAAAINPTIRATPSKAKPSASLLLPYSCHRHRLGEDRPELTASIAMFHCTTISNYQGKKYCYWDFVFCAGSW